ncbi:putative methyltransferase-domain-containing protein [Mycena filopes]|nr:putative methyltransferase-domain-containing protein [Mycena filopes]
MSDESEDPEDILSSSLVALYDYHPIALSSAGSVYTYEPSDSRISKISVRTPDTQAANWSLHASSVWISSRFLADNLNSLDLEARLSQRSPGKRVKLLELGAGAGLPSIVIAKRFPALSVVVSDYPDPELIRTLTENVAANGVSANCRAVSYAWGSDPSHLFSDDNENGPFDLIIAADTLWNPESHAAFIAALKLTLKQSSDSRIHIFAGLHTGRYTIQSFLGAVSAAGFDLEDALERETGGRTQRPWSVDHAESEDEAERRRWIVYLRLKWK